MTTSQRTKLFELVDRYADKRQEWHDVMFHGYKATECESKTNAAFDSIVDYVKELMGD